MSRHITSRVATFATSLLLLFLLLSAATSVARADSDDGIVRVKSAIPLSEAISRIKADIAAKGVKFFSKTVIRGASRLFLGDLDHIFQVVGVGRPNFTLFRRTT